MFKYYKLKSQPEKSYVAGYGIGRSGYPKEWTPTGSNPTKEDWNKWASKAVHFCRWRKLLRVQKIDGVWFWVLFDN